MRQKLFVYIAVFVWVGMLAMSSSQKVEIEDGVRVVHNGKDGIWQKTPSLGLEKIREIGGLEAESDG